MRPLKADTIRYLIEVTNNLDVEKILNSEHRLEYIVNKPYFAKFTDINFTKRISIKKLNEVIDILERYQLGGN